MGLNVRIHTGNEVCAYIEFECISWHIHIKKLIVLLSVLRGCHIHYLQVVLYVCMFLIHFKKNINKINLKCLNIF